MKHHITKNTCCTDTINTSFIIFTVIDWCCGVMTRRQKQKTVNSLYTRYRRECCTFGLTKYRKPAQRHDGSSIKLSFLDSWAHLFILQAAQDWTYDLKSFNYILHPQPSDAFYDFLVLCFWRHPFYAFVIKLFEFILWESQADRNKLMEGYTRHGLTRAISSLTAAFVFCYQPIDRCRYSCWISCSGEV